MIGVVICRCVEGDASSWEIDTWLMSCRVLGRKVEQAMLAEIVATARERGIRQLVGIYSPTAKNGMVKCHYPDLGFRPLTVDAGEECRFQLDVGDFAGESLPFEIKKAVRPEELQRPV